MERNWVSKLFATARDARGILAIAWRMDAQLTFLYYMTAFAAALAPIASGFTLARLIDHAMATSPTQATVPMTLVIAVATRFAIVALNAAIRFGLHEQYYACVFRHRLLSEVRITHQWRVPDFFHAFGAAFIATIGAISAAIAVAPYGAWTVAAVIAGTLPRVIVRIRSREMQLQARNFALRKRPLGRHRRVSPSAPLVEAALAFGLASAMLPDVTAGRLSVGSFALLVTMLHQLATQAADAGGALSMAYDTLLYIRHWNKLLALPRLIPRADQPYRWASENELPTSCSLSARCCRDRSRRR